MNVALTIYAMIACICFITAVLITCVAEVPRDKVAAYLTLALAGSALWPLSPLLMVVDGNESEKGREQRDLENFE